MTSSGSVRHLRRVCVVIACMAYVYEGILYTAIVPVAPLRLETEAELAEVSCTSSSSSSINSTSRKEDAANCTPSANVTFASPSAMTRMKIGFLFSSYAILQIIIAVPAGVLMDRIQYELPLLAGTVGLLVATGVYCISDNYWVSLAARSAQGVGHALTEPAAVGLVATFYSPAEGRQTIICALSVVTAVAYMAGPVYGGFLDEHIGSVAPFGILALGMFVEIALIACIMQPIREHRQQVTLTLAEGTSNSEGADSGKWRAKDVWTLVRDPYVVLCCTAFAACSVTRISLESTIALWMKGRFESTETEIGFVFAPSVVSYLMALVLAVFVHWKWPCKQWILISISLGLAGLPLACVPFSQRYEHVVIAVTLCFTCVAITETLTFASFALVVDARLLTPAYGSIYSLCLLSGILSLFITPLTSNALVALCGFTGMVLFHAVLLVAFSPLLLCLKNIYEPLTGEQQLLVNKGSGKTKADLNACDNDNYTSDADANTVAE